MVPERETAALAASPLERGDVVPSLDVIPTAETTRPSARRLAGGGTTNRTGEASVSTADSQRSITSTESQTTRPNARRHAWGGTANRTGEAFAFGGDSQRSITSIDSQISMNILEEDENRRTMEEMQTMRIVEEAQEEELVRLAMELSLTETSGGSSSPRWIYQEVDSSPHPSERYQRQEVSPPYRRHYTTSPSIRPALKPALRAAVRPADEGSSRSLGGTIERRPSPSADDFRRTASERIKATPFINICPMHSSADDFRRAASERIRATSEINSCILNDLEDLSPRDEPGYRRMLRGKPPPVTNLDMSSPKIRPGISVSINNTASTRSHHLSPSSGIIPPFPPFFQRPGSVSVSSPAPTVKIPRRRTVESFMSPSIDSDWLVAGTASSVIGPAPTTKSPQVRAAIVSHVTSPLVFQRSPIESPAQQPQLPLSSTIRQALPASSESSIPCMLNTASTVTVPHSDFFIERGRCTAKNNDNPTHEGSSQYLGIRRSELVGDGSSAGAAFVCGPASTEKSPRRKAGESVISSSNDRLPGTATSVTSLDRITKSPEVRAAIIKHVTSPIVFQRYPIEPPAQQPQLPVLPSSPTKRQVSPAKKDTSPLTFIPNSERAITTHDMATFPHEIHESLGHQLVKADNTTPEVDSKYPDIVRSVAAESCRKSQNTCQSNLSGPCETSTSSCPVGSDTDFSVMPRCFEQKEFSDLATPATSSPKRIDLCPRVHITQIDTVGHYQQRDGVTATDSRTCGITGDPSTKTSKEIEPSAGSTEPFREAAVHPSEAGRNELVLEKGAQKQRFDENIFIEKINHGKCETRAVRADWQVPLQQPYERDFLDWPTPSEQVQMAIGLLSVAKPIGWTSAISYTSCLVEAKHEVRDLESAMRASKATLTADIDVQKISLASEYDLAGAAEHLSKEELIKIQQALQNVPDGVARRSSDDIDTKPAAADYIISEEDSEAIALAMREAEEEDALARASREAEEEMKSIELVLKIQNEEEEFQYKALEGATGQSLQRQGNVRTMTRSEYVAQGLQHSVGSSRGSCSIADHSRGGDFDKEEEYLPAGFRMNSSAQQQWSRRDQNSVVGPNREVRTKHDTALHGQANAHRLGFETDEVPSVGNQVYNSFLQSMRSSKKGVAAKGTGRAGSDTDATQGGAMDFRVRSQISRAINSELIERCNGVVKEGKEAIIYHADKGVESGGFDVAIKVFKRIQEFRGRGDYVDGDPRYGRSTFRNGSNREQLELWAEKEFRNLVRANRAGVPVPTPLLQKENIVFMRFLGADGWPAPQLRELDLRPGSKKWVTIYEQVVDAVKR